MLQQLFNQYHLQTMLSGFIQVSNLDVVWWVIDVQNDIVYQSGENISKEYFRWDLKSSEIEGWLLVSDSNPKIQALGDVIAQLLTILLQNEAQRRANEIERQTAQFETQIHLRLSESLGTPLSHNEITHILLTESVNLIGAAGALVYIPSDEKDYQLDGFLGDTPYGESPPERLPTGILQHVAVNGDMLWLNTVSGHRLATITEQQARNVLALPIRLHNHFYGIIALFDHHEEFNSKHVRLLQIVSHYGGIAYHNSLAIEQLRYQTEENVILAVGDSDWQEVYEHRESDWQDQLE